LRPAPGGRGRHGEEDAAGHLLGDVPALLVVAVVVLGGLMVTQGRRSV